MKSSPEKFENDNEGYLKWLENNPTGLVVNCYKSPTPSYLKLHKSTCYTINSPAIGSGNWTNNNYIKVCSLNRDSLSEWARVEVGGQLSSCGACKP